MRQQDHFLFQALRVELGLHVTEAVEDLLPLGGEHLRYQDAQGGDLAGHVVQALVDQSGQLGAFAVTAILQFVQGLFEQGHGFAVERLRVGGISHQHARPGQYFERIERCWLLDQAGDCLGGGNQLRGALAINLQGLAVILFVEAQGALDLAARQALAQALAHSTFEVAEGFWQAQVRLQVAMIDRAQFPDQGAPATGALDTSKSGHAVHHGKYLAQ
ncbi:hypothetical protein D3C78_806130 [compost metagenome]